jgi:type IV secretory pathway VirJ component
MIIPCPRPRLSRVLSGTLVILALAPILQAAPSRHLDFPLRGKVLTLTVYAPREAPRGTVIMGSGDVGWVGLAVDLSEYLSDQGFLVVGVNVRQYLGAFTSGKKTLTTSEAPDDYAELARFLTAQRLLVRPVIVSGVSEGAALAVLAGSRQANHSWVGGVMTMGLPPTAELGWRWTDFTSWITKKDSDEPMFMPKEFVPQISPKPLCMIQSMKDEYVSETDYKVFEQVAREPKRLILIDASNHRFTDRRDDLRKQVMGCLAWIGESAAK